MPAKSGYDEIFRRENIASAKDSVPGGNLTVERNGCDITLTLKFSSEYASGIFYSDIVSQLKSGERVILGFGGDTDD